MKKKTICILKILLIALQMIGCEKLEEYPEESEKEQRVVMLSVYPATDIKLLQGEKLGLSIYGAMENGIKKEIPPTMLNIGEMEDGVVNLQKNLVIEGVSPGKTVITIGYESLQLRVNFIVEEPPPLDKIKINEVFYDAQGSDSGVEYIEIKNYSDRKCNLTGFTLVDSSDKSREFIFPENSSINGGEVQVIIQKKDKFKELFGEISATIYEGINYTLNNSGETVILKDSRANILDMVYIEGGSGEYIVTDFWGDSVLPESAEGESIIRDNSGEDTDTYVDWFGGAPTPGE